MRDLVLIAESYFQRLLMATPAAEAVPQLSAEWHRRRTLYGETALTSPERTVDRANYLFFLARIGGHGLLFKHTSLDALHSAIAALREAGLAEAATIVSEALRRCEQYPSTPEPLSQLRRARFVSDDLRYSERDRLLWREPSDDQLLAFMRANAALLLLPERGLG